MAVGKPETWRALRAAWGYSGLGQDELAEKVGVPPGTFRGYLRRGQANAAPQSVIQNVARECGVPPEFMEVGFAPLERPITDMEQRLYELERRVDGLAAAPARLGARLKPVQPKGGAEPDAAPVRPATSRRRGGTRQQDQDGPRTQPGSR